MTFTTRFKPIAIAAMAVMTFAFALPASVAEGNASSKKAESAGAPISLKKFTKKKVRSASARKASRSGKASLRQRAKAGKSARYAARNTARPDQAATVGSGMLAPRVANANAEFRLDENSSAAPLSMVGLSSNEQPVTSIIAEAPAAETVEVADTAEINDIDKAAWAPKDTPKPTPAVLDSRAELREEPSPWQNTSTVGKVFVAIGALLTIGSAIRMCIA